MTYRVRSAKHIGREHLLNFTNCQDAVAAGETNRAVWGVVCDGASLVAKDYPVKPRSEYGAELGMTTLAEILDDCCAHDDTNGEVVGLADWYLRTALEIQLDFACRICLNPLPFILEHFLFTVVGFRLIGDEAVVFWQGDGTILVNDEVIFLEGNNNQPDYYVYQFIPDLLPKGYQPKKLQYRVFTGVQRLMIGSDAWNRERDLLDHIWNLDPDDLESLQRELNVWSEMDHRFGDDVSAITVEVL